MLWMMVMPNGLMTFRVVKGNLNSNGYIQILKECAVPISKLNYVDDFILQEDNASVHKSKETKKFMRDNKINILDWPARSPDINIVEDCWEFISDLVYDGEQFKKRSDLVLKIEEVIQYLNANKREKVIKLYETFRSRLCCVLQKNGNLYNI